MGAAQSFVKTVSNNVSNLVKNTGLGPITPPSYLKWFVIPFVVCLFVFGILFFFLFRNWNTLGKVCTIKEVEEEDEVVAKEECGEQEFKLSVRILIGIVATLIISSSIAGGVYQTGLYINNPGMAVGIEGIRMLSNAIFSPMKSSNN